MLCGISRCVRAKQGSNLGRDAIKIVPSQSASCLLAGNERDLWEVFSIAKRLMTTKLTVCSELADAALERYAVR